MSQHRAFTGDEPLALDCSSMMHDDISHSSCPTTDQRMHQSITATEAERRYLRQQEGKAVSRLRIVVFLALLLTALLISAGVFAYTRNDELTEYKKNYYANARLIIDAFHDNFESNLGTISALSSSITSYAQATEQTLPFVVIKDFAVWGAHTRISAHSTAVQWVPILTNETMRTEWESFTLENRHRIDDSLFMDSSLRHSQDLEFGLEKQGDRTLQEEEEAVDQNIMQDGTGYHKSIWNVRTTMREPEGGAPYVPTWQVSPVNGRAQGWLNMNIASAPALGGGAVNEIIRSNRAVINRAIVPVGQGQKNFAANLLIGQFRENVEQYSADPVSFMGYPVFDSLQIHDRQLKGLIVSNLYWRFYFADVLPDTGRGIICVLENSFNQTLSYLINGGSVEFLGAIDAHDKEFEDMKVFDDVNSYVQQRASPRTRAYTTVPLSESFGLYKLKIYPSQETRKVFLTRMPIVYTAVVMTVFLVTCFVFLAYDWLVEKRQRLVLERAVKAGAIVSSLFPEQVRDRMYSTGLAEGNDKSPAHHLFGSGTGDLESKEVDDSRPIADKFQHTTILFADLAGFTQWSARREPEQVFQLLEKLYAAFDRRAEKRGVFKIETIGDCYVAVTGLPYPQQDHAVRMAEFSLDCLGTAYRLVEKLSTELGADTARLELRIGLHSGPVTAGVLRGLKSRFQIFGDTVNTASRMESNGEPGRVHVSQETAIELQRAGKHHWLEARSDKIVAKGKGELQTYWLVNHGQLFDSEEDLDFFHEDASETSELHC